MTRSANKFASVPLKKDLYPSWPIDNVLDVAFVAMAAKTMAGPAGVNIAAAPATPNAAPTNPNDDVPIVNFEWLCSLTVNSSAKCCTCIVMNKTIQTYR